MSSNFRIFTLLTTLVLTLALAACGGKTTAPAATLAPTATPTAPAASSLPVFSDPTNVTNSFFPVSSIGQAISLSREDGAAYRTEVALLPETKEISLELVDALEKLY
jgi:hypothetical protein